MEVCKPSIRSTANAVQMFAGHVLGTFLRCSYWIIDNHLGDAFSPLLIGAIADKLTSNRESSYYADFQALQYGMLFCPLMSVIGECFVRDQIILFP